MVYSLTKTLGTVRWPVFSCKYCWIASPSSRSSNLGKVEDRWHATSQTLDSILNNMGLNIGEFVAEKSFDTIGVRAPRLWEDDHFVICNGVLHKIGGMNWLYRSCRRSVFTHLDKLFDAHFLNVSRWGGGEEMMKRVVIIEMWQMSIKCLSHQATISQLS